MEWGKDERDEVLKVAMITQQTLVIQTGLLKIVARMWSGERMRGMKC